MLRLSQSGRLEGDVVRGQGATTRHGTVLIHRGHMRHVQVSAAVHQELLQALEASGRLAREVQADGWPTYLDSMESLERVFGRVSLLQALSVHSAPNPVQGRGGPVGIIIACAMQGVRGHVCCFWAEDDAAPFTSEGADVWLPCDRSKASRTSCGAGGPFSPLMISPDSTICTHLMNSAERAPLRPSVSRTPFFDWNTSMPAR